MKPPHARFLVHDEARVREIVASMRRVAVLGIKTEAQAGQPAYDVARYLATHGVQIVPVPVYFPEVTEILGQPVYRKVADVPGELDVVDVFRRPRDLAPHLDDLLAKRPRVVWLQSGIWHAEFAEALARAEIEVVQNRCLMVDLMRL